MPRRSIFALIAACGFAAGGAQAQAVDLPALQRDFATLSVVDIDTHQVSELRKLAGLGAGVPAGTPDQPDTPVPVAGPAAVSSLDVRVALAQLAIHAGANQQLALLQAQGGRSDAIILRGGIASLTEVADLAQTAGLEGLSRDGSKIVLTRPLVVWEGAALEVSDGTQLTMTADSGAFLLSFGHLRIGAATIRATTTTRFRPFILAAGVGSLQVNGAHMTGLGTASPGPYSGLSVVSGGLFKSETPSTIVDTTLDDIGSLSLIRTSASVLHGNTLSDSRGVGLYLSDVNGATIAKTLIRRTHGAQSLRITANSRQITVADTQIVGGANSGVLIDRNARDISFSGNSILAQIAGGLRVQRAGCLLIAGNLIAGNGGLGISLERVSAGRLDGNVIAFNRSAGVSISGQACGFNGSAQHFNLFGKMECLI
jgi:mannuronan 5-epimerase